jgi:hypothetical protein
MIEHPEHKSIGKEWIEKGNWQIDIAGVRYAAIASAAPLYDPANKKIKQ